MLNSSMYLGIVVVSEDDEGNKDVRYHDHGPDYHELTQEDVLLMESALLPLASKYDELAIEANKILLGAGLSQAGISAPGAPGSGNRPKT